MLFEAMSDLEINMEKNELILIEVTNIRGLALVLGSKVGNLPITCLGLLFGAFHNFVKAWELVEVKLQRKLLVWKRSYLSKRGTFTLIRSMLLNLSIYVMPFFFSIPRKLSLRLESMLHGFWYECYIW